MGSDSSDGRLGSAPLVIIGWYHVLCFYILIFHYRESEECKSEELVMAR